MYPNPVFFIDAAPGVAGVLIQWAQTSESQIAQYLVFRFSKAIPLELSEVFYSGEISI
jgi:hypothetical protein